MMKTMANVVVALLTTTVLLTGPCLAFLSPEIGKETVFSPPMLPEVGMEHFFLELEPRTARS
jgi:hypothetical protein